MMSVRWKKVMRDLSSNRSRTALVVLSIAVGIFATGAILGARQVLLREFEYDYANSDRASITMTTSDVDDAIIEKIRARSDITHANGRRVITGRLRPVRLDTDGEREVFAWENFEVNALPDFDGLPGRIIPDDTKSWPPRKGEIVIEKGAKATYEYSIGEQIEVETDNGTSILVVAGYAHDLNAIPARFFDQVTGYVSMETLAELDEPVKYNTVLMDVDERLTRVEAGHIAANVRDEVMTPAGVIIDRTSIPKPGEHFFGDIFRAVSVLLLVMALMALALSAFLVITTTNAILMQQTRQLGIMKAIGGRRWQISRMYIGLVFSYGVLGVIVGLPFGLLLGRWFINYAANILNFHIFDYSYPLWVIGTLLFVGILVPILAALFPISAGVRRTIVDAFNSNTLAQHTQHGLVDRILAKIKGLPRPTALALRSTFTRKGRLIMTLSTLTLASAVVMAVFSANASLLKTADDVSQWWNYDALVMLSQPAPSASLEADALSEPDVTYVESWLDARSVINRPDGTSNEGYFTLGFPAGTKILDFDYTQGRALRPGEKGVILNTELFNDEPYLKPGSKVYIMINGQEVEREVIGVVTGSLMGPYLFFDATDLADIMGISGSATRIVVKGSPEMTDVAQQSLADKLEDDLSEKGYVTSSTQTSNQQNQTTKGQLGILVNLLTIMASALAVVGVIGLAGSMMLSVIESTREIGIMRSIGASHIAIFKIYITQGMVIGTMSWALGLVLSYPLSRVLMNALETAIGMPLGYTFSWPGVGIWLLLVWIISILGSLMPAWRASQISIRDAIAYE